MQKIIISIRLIYKIIFILMFFIFISCRPNNNQTDISLLEIVRSGSYREIKRAIARGADVNETNFFGSTPLMHSFLNRDNRVSKALIRAGADVNAVDSQGWSPLFYAVEIRWDEIIDTLELLVKSGADLEFRISTGQTPLAFAAEKNRNYRVLETLIYLGANVDARNNIGITPLFYAISNNTFRAVDMLIKSGADVNITNEYNQTPLIHAAGRRRETSNDVIISLLDAGADVNAYDRYGLTPLIYALVEDYDFTIIQKLIEKGANINHLSDATFTPLNLTPLMAIALFTDHRSSLILYLLELGADPNIRNAEGKTVADYIRFNPSLRGTEAYIRLVSIPR
ncbi:MAG: ankyrin repeat domain-containing protein [Spirochaetaceae bacterium]|nr:ankyrin repeat domain-containing protein [Spirochaetaceae bacterium]